MKLRKATPQDVSSVFALINELAKFEKAAHAVVITQAQLLKDGFSGHPLFEVIVAELNNEVVGMALYYPRYSTWKGKTLHLEDLIVQSAHRGKGIGLALYKAFIKEAYQQNVERIEWVVLDWNQKAINLYKNSGALILDEWKTVQMNREAIISFLSN